MYTVDVIVPLRLCPAHMLTTSEATPHSLQRLINVCRSSCGCRSGKSRFMRVEIVLRLVFFARSKSINGKTFFTCGVNGIFRSTTFCPKRSLLVSHCSHLPSMISMLASSDFLNPKNRRTRRASVPSTSLCVLQTFLLRKLIRL